MQADAPPARRSLSGLMSVSIVVVLLAVNGLMALVQWTDTTVLQHVAIASESLFPATLMIRRAETALLSMNREYSDAVRLQLRALLDNAAQDAGEVGTRMASAANFMKFNSLRHQQIVALSRRIKDLQLRTKVTYAAAVESTSPPPQLQADLRDVAAENQRLQAALNMLQSDLESDYRAELRLIGRLPKLQGEFGIALLLSVITALFFSTRALIEAGARRRGIEVLHQAHKDTDILLNSLPSLLIGLDANGRIQQWNKAATMILGWQESFIAGKTLDECGVKWLTADISSRVAASVREPAAHRLDNVRLERNGTVRTLGLKAIDLNTENVTGILIVGADITERLELEEQLRQAHKLESIGQLAAGIAHEINTPTQYIGDNVRFLKDAFQDLTPLLKTTTGCWQRRKAAHSPTKRSQEVSAAVATPTPPTLSKRFPRPSSRPWKVWTAYRTLVGAMKEFSHPGHQRKNRD